MINRSRFIQILPYLAEDFPITFDKVHPYVSHTLLPPSQSNKVTNLGFSHQLYYISSALSFYFIYDFCLYSNMSPLVSYFLRYLPLILLSITATVVLSIRYIKDPCISQEQLLKVYNLQQALSEETCPLVARSLVDCSTDVHSHPSQLNVDTQLPRSTRKRRL